MRKYLAIAVIGFGLNATAQPWTNLAAQLQPVFLSMPAAIQANTMAAWADYTRAVNRSPEFRGITTNVTTWLTGTTNGQEVTWATNTITTHTTNNPPLTFVQYYQAALRAEKIGRVVEQRNQDLYVEMYRKVGQTIVNSWP